MIKESLLGFRRLARGRHILLVIFVLAALSGCFAVEINSRLMGAQVVLTPLREPENVLQQASTEDDESLLADYFSEEQWTGLGRRFQLLLLGTLTFDTDSLDPDMLYLLTATGGCDEAGDNIYVTVDGCVQFGGVLRAIVSGRQLTEGRGISMVNLLSESFYAILEHRLDTLTDAEVLDSLDQLAQRNLLDIDGDGRVDYQDVLKWDYSEDQSRYRNGDEYDKLLLSELASSLLANNDPIGRRQAAIRVAGNTAQVDADGDGVGAERDELPFDSGDWLDLDRDGIGDIADPDDDNDGILDEEDRLHVGGVKQRYYQGEAIQVRERMFRRDGIKATESDGYGMYFRWFWPGEEEPLQGLSFLSPWYYPATDRWEATASAPMEPRTYRLEATLYCARGTGSYCDTLSPEFSSYSQNFEIEVVCPPSGCLPWRSEVPATRITSTNYVSQAAGQPRILSLGNDKLVAVFSQIWEGRGNSAVSTNGGATWTIAAGPNPDRNLGFKAEVNSSLVAMPDGKPRWLTGEIFRPWVMRESFDGLVWGPESFLSPFSFHDCQNYFCFEDFYGIDPDLTGNPDTGYVLTYNSRAEPGSYGTRAIFLSTTADFNNWTQGVLISDPAEGPTEGSAALRMTDGRVVAAYFLVESSEIVIKVSNDGVAWQEAHRLKVRNSNGFLTFPNFIRLLERNGKILLLYGGNWGTVFETHSDDSGSFSPERILLDDISTNHIDLDAFVYDNGDLGLLYAANVDQRRDLFFRRLASDEVDGN